MKNPETVLHDIEERSKSEYLPILGRSKGKLIEKLVRERQPCTALEVGVLVGYSSILIARNLGDGCKLVGLELSADLAKRCQENVAAAGLSAKVTMLQGDARELIPALPGPIDFVLLDAEKTQNLNYLKKLEPKLAPGAIIVANNAGLMAARMASYLDYVRTDKKYRSSVEVFGDDAIEVSLFVG
ncbi:class I SAM-dependent methyltransferase [Candidatus Uhrbacteria bacterium]|nr:class I SAM-dependent methyltransferase [Candidatus Uhrbacteria bacterium]